MVCWKGEYRATQQNKVRELGMGGGSSRKKKWLLLEHRYEGNGMEALWYNGRQAGKLGMGVRGRYKAGCVCVQCVEGSCVLTGKGGGKESSEECVCVQNVSSSRGVARDPRQKGARARVRAEQAAVQVVVRNCSDGGAAQVRPAKETVRIHP